MKSAFPTYNKDAKILFDISTLAYELYKQDWIDQHTTPETRQKSIHNYYAYIQECMEYGDPTPDSYESYLVEYGFDGALYVCYDEFCDVEYMDDGYVISLLRDPILIDAYRKDIAEITIDDEEPKDADEKLDVITGNTGKPINADLNRMIFNNGSLEFDFNKSINITPLIDSKGCRNVYYPRMCKSCFEKAKPILGERYHSIAAGWCEIAGCENPAEYYVRFEIDELKDISD